MIKPCAFVPAIIIAKKVIDAKAAVTWKFPVAVAPPCSRLSIKAECVNLLIKPKKSKIGIIPIAFAKRIKKKKVRIKGVQVLTHFGPTFG